MYKLGEKIKGIYEQKGSFAFVSSNNLDEEDIYISKYDSHGAFSLDEVLVEIIKEGSKEKKAEGKVLKIITRSVTKTIGTFHKEKTFGFVVSDNPKIFEDIYIPKSQIKKARNRQKVLIEIIEYPKTGKKKCVGKILKAYDNNESHEADIMSLIYEFNLPYEFEESTLKEASSLRKVDYKSERKRRVDLTKENIFTIDGSDAKDLDDAVSVKYEDGIYTLGVHIADVSFYVGENTFIDEAAYERGTSVYFPGYVVPMLPRVLCEDLCSLNPDSEKFTLSCEITIDDTGKVKGYKFFESVIKSYSKLTYENVNNLLKGDKTLKKEYYDLEEDLLVMKELASKLNLRRKQKGSIDFDVLEGYIEIDDYGVVKDIRNRVRGVSERIIEEFMLAANTCACEFFAFSNVPGIYRAHPEPEGEKLEDYADFAKSLGFNLRLREGHLASVLQEFLKKIEGQSTEHLLKTAMLKCMKKAVYTNEHIPHFALAIEHYTHFTSPIRRYPDLLVHRTIKSILKAEVDFSKVEVMDTILNEKAKHCSKREQVATECERQGDKGISSFGMFIALENTVEGLVTLNSMKDDYYEYDTKNHRLIGREFGRIYKLGDEVDVALVSSSKLLRQIDFEIV